MITVNTAAVCCGLGKPFGGRLVIECERDLCHSVSVLRAVCCVPSDHALLANFTVSPDESTQKAAQSLWWLSPQGRI